MVWVLFVCFDTLRSSQQFFSHVWMISDPLVLNQYVAADKVSCSKTQRSDSAGGESGTSQPLIANLKRYQLSFCALHLGKAHSCLDHRKKRY